MLFGNCNKQEKRIKELEEENKKLKKQLKGDDSLYNEINEALLKFEKGLYDISIKSTSSNSKLNTIKDNLNKAFTSNAYFANEAVQILIEYGNANFAFPVETKNLSGKLGSIILGIRSLGSGFSEILALLDVTDQLNKELLDLSNTSTQLSNASNEQAVSLEETAASLEEITSAIGQNTENTIIMSELSNDVHSAASNGEKLANDTYTSMQSINNEVNAINEAITVIDQIAFQTNILSLNAAVEAATAGEAGKGFAVVAQEVRNLASRSAEAAKEIKDIVINATTKANEGKAIAQNMIDGYATLNENINKQIEIINNVSSASKEQRTAIEQINDTVTQLDQATQQNAASATSISDQCTRIQKITSILTEVGKFTSYDKKANEQVCDIPLMFELNRLKLDHINFKDSNFRKLNEKKIFSVKNIHECNLGKWIDTQEKNNKDFTKTSNWEHLKNVHYNVHNGVKEIIEHNAKGNNNNVLSSTLEIDQAISDVFWTIQQVKRDNCKN